MVFRSERSPFLDAFWPNPIDVRSFEDVSNFELMALLAATTRGTADRLAAHTRPPERDFTHTASAVNALHQQIQPAPKKPPLPKPPPLPKIDLCSKTVPDEFVCGIMQDGEAMENPAYLESCKHAFDQDNIIHWINNPPSTYTPPHCPICRAQATLDSVHSWPEMKKLIDQWKKHPKGSSAPLKKPSAKKSTPPVKQHSSHSPSKASKDKKSAPIKHGSHRASHAPAPVPSSSTSSRQPIQASRDPIFPRALHSSHTVQHLWTPRTEHSSERFLSTSVRPISVSHPTQLITSRGAHPTNPRHEQPFSAPSRPSTLPDRIHLPTEFDAELTTLFRDTVSLLDVATLINTKPLDRHLALLEKKSKQGDDEFLSKPCFRKIFSHVYRLHHKQTGCTSSNPKFGRQAFYQSHHSPVSQELKTQAVYLASVNSLVEVFSKTSDAEMPLRLFDRLPKKMRNEIFGMTYAIAKIQEMEVKGPGAGERLFLDASRFSNRQRTLVLENYLETQGV
ncbi:MAG: hypothetical protein KGZ30_01880 [Anaplasmataceae bacterium]|nr:hypothetical protein [Anaplasmataceae bacterium]